MTQIDMFWFFLMKTAISSDNEIRSLYDSRNDTLFRAQQERGKLISTVNKTEIKLDNTGLYIYNLERLAWEKKVEFLKLFSLKITCHDELNKIFLELGPENLHEGGKIIIRINYPLSMEYTKDLNSLLNEHYQKYYFPLGISENTKVIT